LKAFLPQAEVPERMLGLLESAKHKEKDCMPQKFRVIQLKRILLSPFILLRNLPIIVAMVILRADWKVFEHAAQGSGGRKK
jgi:hypothetical protein